MHLLVTVPVTGPGEPLAAAVALADTLDTRRVPPTLLVGPRPHPEVAAWARARRRVGDAVLLRGTGPGTVPDARLPGHEARLRLTATTRALDALGVVVDGFAAPGGTAGDGVRRALAPAGLDLLLDGTGVRRLDALGATVEHCRAGRASRRRPAAVLVVDTDRPGALDAVDAALAAGHTPVTAPDVVARSSRRVPGPRHDPESWSITA